MTLRNVKPILLTRVRCWVSSMTVSAEIAQMEVKANFGILPGYVSLAGIRLGLEALAVLLANHILFLRLTIATACWMSEEDLRSKGLRSWVDDRWAPCRLFWRSGIV